MNSMYSQKVMEHFKDPKNMGEMEDADGIGEVGNPVCLLPTEKIHKNSDSLSISKLEKGERVLTHYGNYESIIGISSRDYDGKIIRLKNKLGSINLTPEHLIYAIKVPKNKKFLRNKGKKQLIPAWYHAEQLEKGDIILYPLLKKEDDLEFLEINIPKAKYDFKSKEIPNKIPLNEDLLKLFGYFLAEGNIQERPCKNYISFALNINEKEIASEIASISKKLFGLETKLKERIKENGLIVYIYNAKVARWFKSLFGNGAEHKKIPDFLMNLPKEKQRALIYGLWKGDGYVNLNRNGARAGYATISYQIAQQIKTLLLRQKIVPSVYEEKEKKVKGIRHKKAYRIHVGQRDSLQKLCKILKLNYIPKSYESIKSWFDDNYLYTSITDKGLEDYNGHVHNLEIDNAHSFVSEAFSLHNCGDVMRVYIKVGKDKDNKEYIKDIKFQTMGCIAAIATSSMTTELAKGKNLEEAKKITNKDVAESLGSLPAIKMHCSNLAANALKKAIEDYEKKKQGGN